MWNRLLAPGSPSSMNKSRENIHSSEAVIHSELSLDCDIHIAFSNASANRVCFFYMNSFNASVLMIPSASLPLESDELESDDELFTSEPNGD